MAKIKLKGKHIIILGTVILICALTAYFAAPHFIYAKAKNLESSAEHEAASAYYDVLYSYFPYAKNTKKALYYTAHRSLSGELPGYVYIFSESRGMSGGMIRDKGVKESIKKLETLRSRFPESQFAVHALRELGKAYYILGDYDTAVKYLNDSIKESKIQFSESTVLLAKIYMERSKYHNALELLNNAVENNPGMYPLRIMELKGEVLTALGQWEKAREIFKELPQKAAAIYNKEIKEQDAAAMNVAEWEEISQRHLRILSAAQKNNDEKGSITGKVTLENKGLAGAHVYLIDNAVNKDYYTGMTRGMPEAVTGLQGEFTFENLLPGDYTLGAAVPVRDIQGYTLQQPLNKMKVGPGEVVQAKINFAPTIKLNSMRSTEIKDEEIKFKWEEVKGAASYDLFLGPVSRDESGKITASYTTTLRSGIKDNHLTFNIQEEINKSSNFKRISYSNGKASPESILGLLHSEGEYTWGVKAYDSEGNLLTGSTGYGLYAQKKDLPIFKISSGKLTRGDRLVLQKEYQKAAEAYEEQIKDNPLNTHSLLMLARLYQYGEHGNSKPEKAAVYYERLLEIEDTPEVREALAGVYYKSGKSQKALDMYRSLKGTSLESWHTHYQMAKIKFEVGYPQEALSILDEVVSMENGKYARSFPVVVSLLINNPEKALNFASQVDGGDNYLHLLKEYQDRGYSISPETEKVILAGDYESAVKKLTSEQHDLFIKALLKYSVSPFYPGSELDNIKVEIKQGLLKDLLQKLV
ncbi:MAG: tetratricopeptide repeat protein [Clostridiales bacterium]|nr:tetratricopeptide repeat protein [Clostridiales bacterium]MCF8023847.1 tetratricopeptide repeat protein [Clostridiales bacterium]